MLHAFTVRWIYLPQSGLAGFDEMSNNNFYDGLLWLFMTYCELIWIHSLLAHGSPTLMVFASRPAVQCMATCEAMKLLLFHLRFELNASKIAIKRREWNDGKTMMSSRESQFAFYGESAKVENVTLWILKSRKLKIDICMVNYECYEYYLK